MKCFMYVSGYVKMYILCVVLYHLNYIFNILNKKTYPLSLKISLEQNEDALEEEESTSEKPASSIVGKSPFTHIFQVRRDQAECDFLSEDAAGIRNHYLCPSVIDVLLKKLYGDLPIVEWVVAWQSVKTWKRQHIQNGFR